jgi:Trk-type K+ transport system membrane component
MADVLIRWSWPAGAELSWVRGRFTAVNALTLTGFDGTIPLEKYPPFAKGTIFALTVAGALFSMIVGAMAVVRILRMPYGDGEIVRSALILFAVLMAAGSVPLIGGGHEVSSAFMLSASALANSGLHFGPLPNVMNWQTHLVLVPLAVLGSLGLPVLMELMGLVRMRGRLSAYSRIMLAGHAWIYLIGFLAIVLAQWMEMEKIEGQGLKVIATASAAAINTRTFGLPIVQAQVMDVARSVQWLMIPLMIIGGSAAGTAGGIKINSFVAVGRGMKRALRGENVGRGFAIALIWVFTYLAAMVVLFLLLLAASPQMPVDQVFFLTVSALSNVGLAQDAVGSSQPEMDVLAAAMLVGRLLPLGILWWMAMTVKDAEMPVG